MNEAAAREVVLVQAFETTHPAPPSWDDDDRAWATKVALQEGAPGKDPERFVARRAHHALRRLGPREPAAASWLARRLWRERWIAWAAVVGFAAGMAADAIGASQQINLLAPPLWAVLAWNVVVYALLIGTSVTQLLRRRTRHGKLIRLTERMLSLGRRLPGLGAVGAAAGGSARAFQGFANLWLRLSAPLSAMRAATLLHAAAAALGLGLIAGLYLRGLVLDYRAAWESTFLSAVNAHAILAAVLAPASAVSGVALPDVEAFAAMRTAHGAAAQVGAPAAPWIHLFALTLALVVVLPRTVLALIGAARSHWLARHLALPLDSTYFKVLAQAHKGELPRIFVTPYATAPGPGVAPLLRTLANRLFGDTAQIEIAKRLVFGAEDDPTEFVMPPEGTTLVIALFDLTATPEPESQGRYAQTLARSAPTILMIDEAAFVRRFKGDANRLAQRRDAWRVLAVALGTTPVFINSDASSDEGTAHGAAVAMRRPVNAA